MKPTAKIDCKVNDIYYDKGEEITNIKDIDQLIYLNERGFIEPMTMKEIQNYFKKPKIKLIKEDEKE